jgi:protein-tyrosine-phosphatase
LAEAIATKFLAEAMDIAEGDAESSGIRVESAGTKAPPGLLTSARASRIAGEIGVPMERKPARRLTRELAGSVDLILGMEASHLDHLARWGFDEKSALLDPDGVAIPDPRFRNMAFFRQVRDQIVQAVRYWVPRILDEAGG